MRSHVYRLLMGLGLMWMSTRILTVPLSMLSRRTTTSSVSGTQVSWDYDPGLALGIAVGKEVIELCVMLVGLFLIATSGARIAHECWTLIEERREKASG